ncbi:MAG TPA: proton-conducting transporter membrane subunit [Actinomycetales bacterium]|nr:proton-conducting transporter membrane subunit [Actinomycetales bacterium]
MIVALVLLPAVAGAVLLCVGASGAGVRRTGAVAVAAVTAALSVAVAVTADSASAPFVGVDGGHLGLDGGGLARVVVPTVGLVALAVTVFASGEILEARPRFFGCLLLFTSSMLVTVTATTLPTLLIGWELMGAMSYALIAFEWRRAGKVAAGTTAFITTRLADLGLYVAAGAALAGTGSLALDDLASGSGGWTDVAAAGVLLAALGKSAQLPFSAWLSAAMEGPSPVSALLHSATMVAAGGFLLLRLADLLAASGWAATAAAWVGALTALVLGAVACAQRDLKQLLAASTAAQIGFVVLAAGVGATAGGTAQLVAHAAVKASLFVVAGAWLTALGTKQLVGLRGAARRFPALGAVGVVSAAALAGVPPLSLWATKDEVLASVGAPALHLVALLAAALSAAYAAKVVVIVLAEPSPDPLVDVEHRGSRHVPRTTLAPAVALASVGAGLGVVAVPAVAESLRALLAAESQPAPTAFDLAFGATVAVAVAAVAMRWPGALARTERTPLVAWAGLPRLLTARPLLVVAERLARWDDTVIDRAAVGLATLTARAAAHAARRDVSGVDGAVRATARGMVRLGAASRRPQTGLLHQYYAQAVAGLAVLFAVLLIVR